MPLRATFADTSVRGERNSQGVVTVRDWTNGTSNKTAGTTFTDSVTAQAGDLIVVFAAWDPSGAGVPTTTISDSASTSYSALDAQTTAPATTSSGTGVITQAFYGIVPSGVASGTITVTLTLNASVTARAAQMVAFYNAKKALVNTFTSSVGTATTTTLASGIANTGDLVLCFSGNENNTIPTGASDTTRGSWSAVVGATTTGGNANANIAIAAQYKIVTGQGTQTASFASLGGNWVTQTYVIKAA